MKDKSEWVEVASVGNDEEAALIAGLIQSRGIPCEVEGPSTTPLPENLGAFGMSRVMVPTDRADEARRILADQKRDYGSRSADEDDTETGVE
jgi:putative signal transducing protein